MSSTGDPGFHKNLFPDGFVLDILELVLSSWDKFKKPKSDDKENPLNLRFVMFLRSQKGFPELPFNIDPEIILPDEEGRETGRIDIRFLQEVDEQVYFAFECKRLRYITPSGSLVTNTSDYVGDQGMMCFVLGKYSPELHSGGMIGYVLDGEKQKAKEAVKQLIEKKRKPLLLESNSTLAPSPINPKKIDETKHDLAKRKFTLYHLFLRV